MKGYFCLLNNEESVIVISDNVYMDECRKFGKGHDSE